MSIKKIWNEYGISSILVLLVVLYGIYMLFKYLDSKGKPVASDKNGNFYIYHSHKLQNGVLFPTREIMLPHLEESKWLDLNSLLATANSQGIATTSAQDGQGIYFYKPLKDNKSVAGFVAGSNRASFYCDRIPTDSSASLGVRYARRVAPSVVGNKGGKK